MSLDLSVIIPCYNCEQTIRRCLDSIPKKLGIEIILINDCSEDHTAEEIKNYQDLYPKEDIKLFTNQKNCGAGETRNIALHKVSKKYLLFLDSDDKLSDAFANQIVIALQKNIDCLIFDAELVSANNSHYIKMFYSDHIIPGIVPQKEALVFVRPATCGKLYRSELIKNNKVQFGSIKRNEDLVFTKTALCYCKNIVYLDLPLYLYYDNPNSLMHNKALLTEKNAINAINLIEPVLLQNHFISEYNSIYFLEIVYATTMTLLRLKRPIKEINKHFKIVDSKYNKKDRYRKKYMLKYRLSYLLYNMRLFFLFRILFR